MQLEATIIKKLIKRIDMKITLVVFGEYPLGVKNGSRAPRKEMDDIAKL